MRYLCGFFLLLIWLSAPSAQADVDVACQPVTSQCILEAAWGAALLLPAEKQERLHIAFLETAERTGDPKVVRFWRQRFNQHAALPEPKEYPDFGWQIADPILQQQGVDGLIALAEKRQAPLSFARADALYAAGRHFYLTRPAAAAKINAALLKLSLKASDFEQPSLADAAAQLAMQRCDLSTFTEALKFADAPDSLRYAFWAARLRGDMDGLPDRIRADAIDDDTRHVRQVLDGYNDILSYGFC